MIFKKKKDYKVQDKFKGNMFDIPDDGQKIYSLNKLAYLYQHGIELNFEKDKSNGKYYAIVDEKYNYILEKYKTDVKLHAFLNAYRILRENINNLRLGVKVDE